MKRLLIVTILAASISGCATTGGGAGGVLDIAKGLAGQANDAMKPPQQAVDYMKFAEREEAALDAVIGAQKKAGLKPAGKLQTVIFQKGLRSYKILIAGEAMFQVPTDSLIKRSAALISMLKSFGGYVKNRPEPTQIIVAGSNKEDVDFMKAAIKTGAQGLLITPVVKEAAEPFIGFVSKGGAGVRKI
jgi:hypothetical protein